MKRALAVVAMLTTALAAQSAWAQFYARADLGGAFSTNTDFTDVDPTASNALLGPGVAVTGDPGSSVIIGAGVGYRFTPAFRADFTLDYMPSFHFDGTGPGFVASADVNSLVGLFNGYIDLNGLMRPVFPGFEPYVDFGIGWARNEVGTASISGVTISGDTNTSFAWGIGAGVGYAVMPKVTLDFAYKYLDLGEMRTGTTLAAPGIIVPVGATKAGLQAHTFAVSARVTF